jgi:hypothetical protein
MPTGAAYVLIKLTILSHRPDIARPLARALYDNTFKQIVKQYFKAPGIYVPLKGKELDMVSRRMQKRTERHRQKRCQQGRGYDACFEDCCRLQS